VDQRRHGLVVAAQLATAGADLAEAVRHQRWQPVLPSELDALVDAGEPVEPLVHHVRDTGLDQGPTEKVRLAELGGERDRTFTPRHRGVTIARQHVRRREARVGRGELGSGRVRLEQGDRPGDRLHSCCGPAVAPQRRGEHGERVGFLELVARRPPVRDCLARQLDGFIGAVRRDQREREPYLECGHLVRRERVPKGERPLAVPHGLAVRRASRCLERGLHRLAGSGGFVAARVGVMGDPRRIDARPSGQRGDDAAVQLAPVSLAELGLDSQAGDLVPECERPALGDEHTTLDAEIDVAGSGFAHRVDEPRLGSSRNHRHRVDDGAG
jgi:hypothetical protein